MIYNPNLDYTEGDCVQIRTGDRAGKLGIIIGIKYQNERLHYVVRFSDNESACFTTGGITFISHAEK